MRSCACAFALVLAAMAPAAGHAATMLTLSSSMSTGRFVDNDPVRSSGSQLFSVVPGPTRASGEADQSLGVLRARAVHFGTGATDATASMDPTFRFIGSAPGERQTMQLSLNGFSDSFGSQLPVGSGLPGGLVRTDFAANIMINARDIATGFLVGNAQLSAVHTSRYRITLDDAQLNWIIRDETFAYRETPRQFSFDFIGPFQSSYRRTPSVDGVDVLFTTDLLADPAISYELSYELIVQAYGAAAHGINADASRSAYVGFDLTDGARLVSDDGFLSEVDELELGARLGSVPAPIPVPASLPLLLAGLAGLVAFRQRAG